ncbi:hypothetical protein [Luteococcus peritonei]|uniref:DUF4192 family protein n=1 Tax=Luteococcus peritonei TaxID=88874 RepID=A0ABW4RUC1_9ACTN
MDNNEPIYLDDPDLLAAVVDRTLPVSDRTAGSLLLLLCDQDCRLLLPMLVDDVPLGCGRQEQEGTADRLAWITAQSVPGGAVALAVGRPGQPVPTLWERDWRRALALATRRHGLRDLGCLLATEQGVRRLDDDEAAAA